MCACTLPWAPISDGARNTESEPVKRRTKIAVAGVVAVLLSLGLVVAGLLSTESGMNIALQLAQRAAPGSLTWQRATGRLIGPLQLEAVDYQDASGRYQIARIAFDWSPGRLLARRFSIHQLHLDDVRIALTETPPDPDPQPIVPGWRLPLELVLRDLAVNNLRIQIGNAEPLIIASLTGAASSGLEWLDIQQLQLDMAPLQVGVQGRLGLGRQMASDLALVWHMDLPGYAPVSAEGQLKGTWEESVLTQQFRTPLAAHARIEIQQPFADLHWVLELNTPVTLLTQINATWPAQQIGGTLRGSGTLASAELSADLQTDWAAPVLYPLRTELTVATGDDGSLRVQPLLLRQGDSQLRLIGSWYAETERFTAHIEAQKFSWPLIGAAQMQIPEGELQLSGTVQDYQIKLAARLEGKDFPAADLQADGQGSQDGLRLDKVDLHTLDGVMNAQGQLAWAPQLRWDLQLDAADINPGKQWPAWPGKLSAQVRTTGSDSPQGLTLAARIAQLSGVLRGYPVSGTGAVTQQQGQTQVESVQLKSGDAQLDLNGSIAESWDLTWVLQAPDLAQLLPTLAGSIDARGAVSGARAQPRVQAHAALQNFVVADARLAALQLDADVSLRPGAELSLKGRGKNLQLADRKFDSLDVDLAGSLERHVITLQAQGAANKLQVAGRGGWDGTRWSGRLERGDWESPELGAWALHKPVGMRLAAEKGAIENVCWQQLQAKLCAQLDYSTAERHVQADLTDLPLSRLQKYLPPDVKIDAAAVTARVDARLPAQGAARAEAQFQVSPGTLTWNDVGHAAQTEFGGANGELHLDAKGLRSTLQLRLSGTDQLSLQANLPGYQPGVTPETQRLNGQLRGEVRDFELLNAMLEAVDDLSGVVRLDAELAGTLADPAVRGELRLIDGRGFISPAGVQLEDWQLTLAGDPADGKLRLQSSARSGPGTVQLDGWLAQLGGDDLTAEFHIGGTGFEAVNLPEARVLVTPDLLCKIRSQSAEVTGTVLIPEARIEPRDLSGAVTPSKDVVLVTQGEAPPPGWKVSNQIKLSLGDKVIFDGFGLKGRLTGAVDVTDLPNRVPLGRGELTVKDGQYAAYGQELKIEQGRVLYLDSPLDNPALDVRAVRKTGDVTAGLRVLGTAQKPNAELYSQPSMPQADALSYLLLGHPVASASSSEGELLFKAASSVGLKGGNQLAQNIGKTFGLDEVSVEGGEDLDSTALTLGKYLSPGLYVNYSVGLLDAANRLRIRYHLSKHLSVQTETGTATGGDILYTIER